MYSSKDVTILFFSTYNSKIAIAAVQQPVTDVIKEAEKPSYTMPEVCATTSAENRSSRPPSRPNFDGSP